ncbi:class II aldolase/adducin family protein [Plebeiibacterium sediminum]|uniref:Class II aldolase/adducin family protein n=1 Tax=Plebeiibacterium sediminum TaxID=2992112 RepID=A0AAE3SDJ4_9BACT|nr:class II aldolase/adducin family protein [Plebeiobacterium sediminum]MCW3785295.1 class II aldolase/adducin family protein [Plebeiobacterium sediminum]
MENNLNQLVKLSQRYGQNPEYIIAGGGNSSFKNDEKMWVKASGTSMGNIEEDGFVCLDREKMQIISGKKYSENVSAREQEVKEDLHNAILFPEGKRPSVEASMHEIIRYAFIMHTHPTLVNGVLCANNSKEVINDLFGDEVVYVPYTDPGYILFKEVDLALQKYRTEKGKEPQIIFLENHGVFVGAETTDEINQIYTEIENKLNQKIKQYPQSTQEQKEIIPADIKKSIESCDELQRMATVFDSSDLTKTFIANEQSFEKVNVPFTPDNIVYCKSKYLFVIEHSNLSDQVAAFKINNGYNPKVIVFKGVGIVAVEESLKSAQIVMDVFKDMMKVSYLSESFGGPRPMTARQIDFIDNWEVENYRRQMSKAN